MAAARHNLSPKKSVCAPKFLAMFRECGNVRASCRAAGINRETYRVWRRDDPAFDAACADAADDALDSMEETGRQRAMEMSDTLMIFFLKAGRPEKYRDRHLVEVLKRYEELTEDDLTELLARRLGEIAALGEDRASGAAGEIEPAE
jgi:hypothetical protein